MKFVKCVVVGNGAVGKTCMLISYTTKVFPEDYVPTVFDNYEAEVETDQETVTMGLWDTAGQEDYARLRPLSYADTDVFLICFSVESGYTFDAIERSWIPEIQQECPDTPFLIVGCKEDLRKLPTPPPELNTAFDLRPKSTYEQGAKDLGAKAYFECSAKEQTNIDSIFQKAALVALSNERRPQTASSSGCGCEIV